MDLAFDEHQSELGGIARQLFASRCPPATVRALEEDPAGFSRDLWEEMGRLDWIGLGQPESAGGSGGTVADLAAIYVEMGRALVPGPHLASAVICGGALVAAGVGGAGGGDHGALTRAVLGGSQIVVPALSEPGTTYGPEAVKMAAEARGAGFRLEGVKLLVAFANSADRLLVTARTGPAVEDITLFLVDPAAAGVEVEATPNVAGYPLFGVMFRSVDVGADAVVGPVGGGWALLRPALERATVLRCAEIVGAGERVLEMAVGYALQREQFGQPIGRFQAVQYLCTDIAIATHLTALLTRQAAWRLDQGGPAGREVSMAKAYGSRAAQQIVHRGHEVHAGVAFMMEADMQLYTRRARHWELDLGDARYHDELIARSLEA
ncbi:MAG TPA: acyl-CoA dehydrogenase family protein [Acidimicrobiales bacterium]|nr:acyl-CoA dehydrogenase family protein [Acidimicrobiales bacterium]